MFVEPIIALMSFPRIADNETFSKVTEKQSEDFYYNIFYKLAEPVFINVESIAEYIFIDLKMLGR